MLTLKQVLIIATRRSAPPWHAGELRSILKVSGPLSLRSAISSVEEQKMVLFVQIRDLSLLKSVTTLAELRAAWRSSHPGKDTVNRLSQELAKSGVTVNFISTDGQTVGLAGKTNALAGIATAAITSPAALSGASDALKGAGILVGAIAALAGGPPTEAVYWIAVAGGTVGTLLTAVGIAEVINATSGQPVPPAVDITLPSGQGSANVYGSVPPGPTVVTNLGDVESWVTDLGDVESWATVIDLGDVDSWPEAAGSGAPTPVTGDSGDGGPGDDDDDDDEDEDVDEDVDVE